MWNAGRDWLTKVNANQFSYLRKYLQFQNNFFQNKYQKLNYQKHVHNKNFLTDDVE